MRDKLTAALPLAIVVGVLAFAWTELAFNFTFHWFSAGDLGNGLSLPSNFQLVVPAGFVGWGFFFAAGADNRAIIKTGSGILVGGAAALITIVLASWTADFPDFWGIALWVGVASVPLVALTAAPTWHSVPASFGAFASVFFYWIATGIDFWFPSGGGARNTVEALAEPAAAGTGAFGGVLSLPFGWVWFSITVSLLCGIALGTASVRLAGVVTRIVPTKTPGPSPSVPQQA
ncbi:DUF1097 domain-containing protein [Actinomycetes bacterium M1A6_2h]